LARVEVPRRKKANWKAHYLEGKFLKTDVAVQEVGPRYLARGLEQCHRLAGWHEWAKGGQFGLSLFSQ